MDFPKRTLVDIDDTVCVARKHGIGIAFESEGHYVDVPHGLDTPSQFDSSRFFDYLKHSKKLAAVGDAHDPRQALEELLAHWAASGRLARRCDRLGRVMYYFPEQGRGHGGP